MSQETKGGSDSVPRKGDWSGFYGGSEENRRNAGKLVDAMFPEGGKKTFLSEENVAAAIRLKVLRSTVEKLREDIRQKESLKEAGPETPDLDKTIERLGRELRKTKRERDRIAYSLNEVRAKASESLAEADTGLEELKKNQDFETDPEYRKKVRERFLVENTIRELNDIIGENGKRNDAAKPLEVPVTTDTSEKEKTEAPVEIIAPAPEEVASPIPESGPKPETAESVPSVPVVEADASGKREASLRNELELEESVIREKRKEKKELERRLEELNGSKGDLGKAEGILTGAKSIGPTREKIRKELSEKIKLVDEHIKTTEEEMTVTKKRLDRLIGGSETAPRTAESDESESRAPSEQAVESGNDGTDIVTVEPEAAIGSGDGKGVEAHEPEPEGRIVIFNSDAEPDSSPEPEKPEVAEPPVSKEAEPEASVTVTEAKPGTEAVPEKEKTGVPASDKEPAPISEAARERFKSLGIWEKELSSFDFSGLSQGQQVFVAEMLRQTAVRNVEDRAQEKAKEGLSIFRSFRLAKARKEFANGIGNGGVGEYGDELRQLIEGARMSGLDMEEKDGKFDIRFFSPTESMGSDESLKKWSEEFNEAASRFSKIPFEWSYGEATEEQRKTYEDGKKVFEEARDRMEKAMFSPDRGESAKEYAGLTKEYGAVRAAENHVRLVQHIQAHPEVGEYLETLKHQSVIGAFFRTTAVERGGYFAAGVAGRVALAGLFGWVAAPVVAAGMGAFTSRRRAKDSLREQDRKARRGESSEGKSAGTARAFVKASIQEDPSGKTKKMGLVEKLDFLSGKIAEIPEADAEEKERELKSLHARISYTRRKLESGLVDFGSGKEAIRSQVLLAESLAKAEMTLGLYDGKNEELEKRLDTLLGNREEAVDSARRGYVLKETLKGAAISGVISLAGSATAHAASEWFSHNPGPTSAIAPSGTGAAREAVADAAAGKGVKAVEAAGKAYSETAGRGDGVTNLARRAFAEYSGNRTDLADLKPEQKVYIEDYLQKHIAHSGALHPGDRVEFPRDLMDEAIGKARGLSQAQVDNLHKYSERVAEFRTGTPSAAEHVGTPFGESVRSVASGAEVSAGDVSVSMNITEQLPPSGSVRIDMNEALPWEPDVREWTPGYDDGKILYPTLDKAPESVIRSMAGNREAIEFLSGDTRRLMPFQETMRTLSGDLFPSGTGGMDKRMFLEVGGRSSKDVFKACFLSVDDPSRGAEFGMDADEAGRLGKFLLAANDRYGISPRPDGSETFREYLERVSIVMVGRLDRASALRDVRVSDDRLHAFAGAFAAKR